MKMNLINFPLPANLREIVHVVADTYGMKIPEFLTSMGVNYQTFMFDLKKGSCKKNRIAYGKIVKAFEAL